MRGNGASGGAWVDRGRAAGWAGRWAARGAAGIALALSLAGPLAAQEHLLLSEGANQPTTQEFIEIANPTNVTWDLSDVYLSDDQDYALLSGSASGAGGPAPSIGSFDFIARFPAGTVLGAGEILVVATDGAGFESAYGRRADFELRATSSTVPDMVIVAGSTGSISLTNSGEPVALFSWDGQSDLVQDLDLIHLGKPTVASNKLVDKAAVSVDGPDAGTTSSTYLTDAMVSGFGSTATPASGKSTKRLALEAAGGEVSTGGNGIGGHDETSEDLSKTWSTTGNTTVPNPGVVSFSLVTLRDRNTATLPLLAGGTADQLLLRWVADATRVATGTDTQLTEVTITDTGAGPIGAVSGVSVYLDTNSNGTLEPGSDTRVASSTFPSTTATRTLSLHLGQAAKLNGSATDTYFVTYDFAAGTLSPGDTFRVKLQVTSTTPAAAMIGNPVQGPLHNDIQPILLFTDLNPSGQQVTTGTKDVLVLATSLVAIGRAVAVDELELTASGSGDDQQDLTRVAIYRDDGDARFEPLTDTRLDERTGFPTDNGTILFNFNGTPLTVSTLTPERLFLALDLGGSAQIGQTFRVRLASASSTAVQVTGLPIVSAQVTVTDAPPTLTVSRGPGGGSGCRLAPSAPPSRLAWVAALVLALVFWRRRRVDPERRET